MGVILNNVVGFSIFGLAVRLWQLGLVNRPLFKRNELWTHASYMVAFGVMGYGVVHLEERVSQRLAELRELQDKAKSVREIRDDRRRVRIDQAKREMEERLANVKAQMAKEAEA